MIANVIAGLLRLLTGARAVWLTEESLMGNRVFFSNHTSHLDAVTLWASLPAEMRLRTKPVAAADYWGKTATRRFLARKVFNAVLIEREKVTQGSNPIPKLVEALDEGISLIIFPEGTRSDGVEPARFKSGLFHIARQRPGIPLQPVYLGNFGRVLPKGEFLPVPLLTTVTIGSAVHLKEAETKAEFLERARKSVWDLHSA